MIEIFVLFYDVHKENMFTINLEDGREAPSKASFSNYFKIDGSVKIIINSLSQIFLIEFSYDTNVFVCFLCFCSLSAILEISLTW